MIPGPVSFLIVALAAGVALLFWQPTRRWGRGWLLVLAIGYWLISAMPVVDLLARTLTWSYRPITSAQQLRGASAIVILGGGNQEIVGRTVSLDLPSPSTANRVLEGIHIYRMMEHPWVIPSGGVTLRDGESEAAGMRALLVRFGVPDDRIILEDRSHTTHEEAVFLPAMLRAHGISQFVLVTSPIHMRRALGAFHAQGLYPIPAISMGLYRGDEDGPWWRVVPSGRGLEFGDRVAHEYLGWLYYWTRGWLKP